ncbi:MAG: phosphoesterase [Thermoleophilaceae bacterium]|nr:phosphoesterase [Thermoleophilaceae bacterium]
MARVRLLSLAGAAVAAVALAVACGSPASRPHAERAGEGAAAAARTLCGTAHGRRKPIRHVVWIVFENKSYGEVIGSRDAPYINRVARLCGLAASFFAETHPSLPNYIALTSGSTQGIRDDAGPDAHRLSAPSIFSLLGTRWRALQEAMPSPCATRDSGRYAVRHNPAAYYMGVRGRCARQDVPLGRRPDISARFTFITPDLCHDMHDCDVRAGDRWLARWLPRILSTREYRSGTAAVFVTWDEDDFGSANRIPTLVISPSTPRGTVSPARFDHYSLLRTTQELLGVRPLLGRAARAPSMRRAFGL